MRLFLFADGIRTTCSLACIGQSAWCINNMDKQLIKVKAQWVGESCCVVGAGDCVEVLAYYARG